MDVERVASGVTAAAAPAARGGSDGPGTCTVTRADGSTAGVKAYSRLPAALAPGETVLLGWNPRKGKWYIRGDC